MRSNYNVVAGQVWQSSDPRRLSAFRIRVVDWFMVTIEPLYPANRPLRLVPITSFQITGSKGYTLLRDVC